MVKALQTSARRRDAPAGNTPSWFTPLDWFFEFEERLLRARQIPDRFNFDPCGHPEAPVSREILHRGGSVYTVRDNGLITPWPRWAVAFVNPPYDSDAMEGWAPLMVRMSHNGHPLGALIPAWTDRAWWHDWIEPRRVANTADVRFLPGRMRFGWPGNPMGIGGDTSSFPLATVVWRSR